MNQDNVKYLVDEFYFAAEDNNATLDDILTAVEFIIAREASHVRPGMTEGWHRVDVITHLFERVSKAVRGSLSRYGNEAEPKR